MKLKLLLEVTQTVKGEEYLTKQRVISELKRVDRYNTSRDLYYDVQSYKEPGRRNQNFILKEDDTKTDLCLDTNVANGYYSYQGFNLLSSCARSKSSQSAYAGPRVSAGELAIRATRELIPFSLTSTLAPTWSFKVKQKKSVLCSSLSSLIVIFFLL